MINVNCDLLLIVGIDADEADDCAEVDDALDPNAQGLHETSAVAGPETIATAMGSGAPKTPYAEASIRRRLIEERIGGQICCREQPVCLEEIDQAPFDACITVDIGLGVLNRPMASELLTIAQATARLGHEPRGVGDEGAPPGVRRAAVEPQISI